MLRTPHPASRSSVRSASGYASAPILSGSVICCGRGRAACGDAAGDPLKYETISSSVWPDARAFAASNPSDLDR